MLRFSLLSLFGAVLVVSIGCGALVSASDAWTRVVVTATVVALLVATVGAFYLPVRSRAFAGGFALCGWDYLLVAQGPWFESLKPQLATTLALNHLAAVMHANDGVNGIVVQPTTSIWTPQGIATTTINVTSGMMPAGGSGIVYATPTVFPTPVINSHGNFQQIGQLLWTLLLAFGGGILAAVFANRKSNHSAGTVQPSS